MQTRCEDCGKEVSVVNFPCTCPNCKSTLPLPESVRLGAVNEQGHARFCPRTLSPEDYIALAKMARGGHKELASILSRNGHASWTGCPECHVDDFMHVETCSLLKKVKEPNKR